MRVQLQRTYNGNIIASLIDKNFVISIETGKSIKEIKNKITKRIQESKNYIAIDILNRFLEELERAYI